MRTFIQKCALVLAGLVIAGQAPANDTVPSDVDTLKRLSVAWMQAIENKDEPALQAILAPDYVLMASGDPDHTPRSEWIANAIRLDWSKFRYENLRVRLSGDRASVSSRLYFRVSPIPIELDSGVLDTWEKRNGKWQVTGRYLGKSDIENRVALGAGLLAGFVLVAMAFVLAKLVRRIRSRAA